MNPADAPASGRFFGTGLSAVRSSQNLHRFWPAVAQSLSGSLALAWLTFAAFRFARNLPPPGPDGSDWHPVEAQCRPGPCWAPQLRTWVAFGVGRPPFLAAAVVAF